MTSFVAIKSVEFASQITGLQLHGLLKQMIESDGKKTVYNEHYFDGPVYELGQASMYPFDHIRVVPDLGSPYFSLDKTYSQALVTSHPWHTYGAYEIMPANDTILQEVLEFAEELMHSVSRSLQDGTFPTDLPEQAGGWHNA